MGTKSERSRRGSSHVTMTVRGIAEMLGNFPRKCVINEAPEAWLVARLRAAEYEYISGGHKRMDVLLMADDTPRVLESSFVTVDEGGIYNSSERLSSSGKSANYTGK